MTREGNTGQFGPDRYPQGGVHAESTGSPGRSSRRRVDAQDRTQTPDRSAYSIRHGVPMDRPHPASPQPGGRQGAEAEHADFVDTTSGMDQNLWEPRPVSFQTGRWYRLVAARRLWAALAVFLAVAGPMTYLVLTDSYRAEIDILFLTSGPDQAEWGEEDFGKAVRKLSSPALLHLVAQDLYTDRLPVPETGQDGDGRHGLWGVAATGGASRFSDPVKFVKWLSDELVVDSEPSKGTASVSIAGDDPEFARAILTSLIKHYKTRVQVTPSTPTPGPSRFQSEPEQKTTDARRAHLEKSLHQVRMQRRECRLALNLMDSGRGVFRGVPATRETEKSSPLNRFQSRIVDLEIKKKALALTFNPGSRELRTIDAEIRAVRDSMKEWIRARLVFLTRSEEALSSEMRSLKKGNGPKKGSSGPVRPAQSREGMPPASTSTRCADLHLFDSPVVIHEPMLVWATNHATSMYRSASAGIRSTLAGLKRKFTAFPFSCQLDHLDRPSERTIAQPAKVEGGTTGREQSIESEADGTSPVSETE